MCSIIQESFGINLKVMRILGLYPTDTHKSCYKMYAYGLYFIFAFHIPVLGFLNLILEEIDQLRLGDNAFLVAETGCSIMKLLPFIMNGIRIKKCIHFFESSKYEGVTSENKDILNRCVGICRRNSRVFLISAVFGLFSWAGKPFIGYEYQFPVDVWLPLTWRNNVKLYWIIFSLIFMGGGYAATASATIDTLVGGLACLAAAQLEILKENLEHLSDYDEHDDSTKKSKTLRKKIKECLKHHIAILSFVDTYKNCFSMVVFSQFSGSVVVICFCCFQLSKVEPMTFSFFSMLSYLMLLLAEIYFYCYYGTVLSDQSTTLPNAIYMGTWYEYDIISRKNLIIIMERSKKPINVAAGKILYLSLVTFTMILRRSYSLLAVLQNNQINPNIKHY